MLDPIVYQIYAGGYLFFFIASPSFIEYKKLNSSPIITHLAFSIFWPISLLLEIIMRTSATILFKKEEEQKK